MRSRVALVYGTNTLWSMTYISMSNSITKSVHFTRAHTWNAPPLGDSARLFAPARARLSSASTVSVVAAHRPAQGSQPSML